jgi:4-amino-4-deoxy-L-arabinose transferase-like glycosyltransferase
MGAIDAGIIAAAMSFAAILMVASGNRRGVELMPWPDGLEYAATAINLNSGAGPVLHFGQYTYPSRYPQGYPLILAATYRILGSNVARMYLATTATGLAAIAGIYALALAMFSRRAATISAFIVAASPVFITYSTLVLSDVPAFALTVAAALAMSRASEMRADRLTLGRIASAWAIVGLAVGFSTIVRPTNAVMIVAMALAIAMARPPAFELDAAHVAAIAGGFIAGIALPLAYQVHVNIAQFGSAFASGYQFWVPEAYGAGSRTFSLAYVFGPTMPRNPHGNAPIYFTALAGLDGLLGDRGDRRFLIYPFAAFAFGAYGIATAIKGPRRSAARRTAILGVFFLAALAAIYTMYFFTDVAFVLPGVFAIFAFAGEGCVRATAKAREVLRAARGRSGAIAAAYGVFALDAMLALSLIVASGARLASTPRESAIVPALEALDASIPRNATVVSNVSLQFLELYLGSGSRRFIGLNSLDPGERFTDYHLHRLFDKRAAGWKGEIPAVIFAPGPDSSPDTAPIEHALADNRTVVVAIARPQSAEYGRTLKAELDALSKVVTLKSVAESDDLIIYRASPASGPP